MQTLLQINNNKIIKQLAEILDIFHVQFEQESIPGSKMTQEWWPGEYPWGQQSEKWKATAKKAVCYHHPTLKKASDKEYMG